MIKLTILILVLISSIACSSTVSSRLIEATFEPTISPTSTIVVEPTEIVPLATIDRSIANQLETNKPYNLNVMFLQSALRIQIFNNSIPRDILAEYELTNTIESDSKLPLYATTEQFDLNWLGSYLLHPVNAKSALFDYPIQEIDGMFVISESRDVLVVGECLVTGGRGQWCGASNLWVYDLTTGFHKKYRTDLKWLYNLQFSDQDTELIVEGCLEQPNAHFGWCGDSAIIRINIADGTELERIILTPTPKP